MLPACPCTDLFAVGLLRVVGWEGSGGGGRDVFWISLGVPLAFAPLSPVRGPDSSTTSPQGQRQQPRMDVTPATQEKFLGTFLFSLTVTLHVRGDIVPGF